MKFVSRLLLTLGLALCARPAAAAFVNGRSYLSLHDWSAANGFRPARPSRTDEFVVTNHTQRLVFLKDSRRAESVGG